MMEEWQLSNDLINTQTHRRNLVNQRVQLGLCLSQFGFAASVAIHIGSLGCLRYGNAPIRMRAGSKNQTRLRTCVGHNILPHLRHHCGRDI